MPDTEPIRIGGLLITPGNPRIVIDGRPVYLSRQELTLLQTLARNAERAVSVTALATSMARNRKPLTNAGVFVQVHRLRARLKSTGVLIRTAHGFGYVLEVVTKTELEER
jgi:DNA-binding response OmpR family regulator